MTDSDQIQSNSPSATDAPAESFSMTPAKWLRQNAKRAGKWPRISVIMGGVSTLFLLIQAWAIAIIAQRMVIEHAAFSSITVPVIVLPFAFIARGLCSRFKTIAGAKASILVRQSVRDALLSQLNTKGPLWVRHQHSATLNTRVWEEVDALDGFYANFLPQMTLCGLIPLIILVIVFPINWAAGLVFLITGPMIPLNMAMVGMGAKNLQDAQFREMGRLNRHFLDTIRGLPTLKLFGLGRIQARAVERVSEDFRIRTMKVLKLAFLSSTALEFFSSVSIAILAIYIGFTYLGHFHFGTWDHGLSLFSGLFMLILAPEFYQPLRDLGTFYHDKAAAEAAAENLIPMLDDVASKKAAQHVDSWAVPKQIELKVDHLTARYSGTHFNALEDINFTLAEGETLAVIGQSGAGKSTLLNILLGFMQPTSGEVSCNQTPIAKIPNNDWHKSLAWVGQHAALIKGTLADNLNMAATESTTEEDLWTALKKAELYSWAKSLPNGLSTLIGEGGQPVSGGQARRISLARAFLRNAPLTLLDEPTASLDVESERKIIDGLETLGQGRSMIMLTHRLELLRLADHILVLKKGKQVAYGNFDKLSQPGGPLAYLAHAEGGLNV
ncbi:ATP-binding/permease protein CydD [Halomonadaceae bacterium LMG 33818]|uniref:thiol reductant ABC exporter subunit CydD n=1 Tax=Cernens ardua TaxID=3402176 RepID=UPI003EDB7A9E